MLEGLTSILPDADIFLYPYIRKEAVLSSYIEGTQTTISELMLFENNITEGIAVDDAKMVLNYVEAINYGIDRIKNFPLSLRLIKEIHAKLLFNTRGREKSPGEFRSSQNWVGGSRPGNAAYVPPPAHELLPLLGGMEKFLHNTEITPVIKAGLVHAQFESIHPFYDGNGRLGRLLITFILCAEGVLCKPMLYLSLYFKQNRNEYYERLQKVRTEGAWESWMEFYLEGVAAVARQAVEKAKQLLGLFDRDLTKIKTLGRSSGNAALVFNTIKKSPYAAVPDIVKNTNLSFPAAQNAVMSLQKLGILSEITGKKRHRIYRYNQYMEILSDE
jgi:Fic family protein